MERAGSVSLGPSAEARERLRARLHAADLLHRRLHQRAWPIDPVRVALVDCHGPARGPVRDAVLRRIGPTAQYAGVDLSP
jgi:hypothetical protein